MWCWLLAASENLELIEFGSKSQVWARNVRAVSRKRPRLSTSLVKRSKVGQAEVCEINTHPLFPDGNMQLLECASS